MKGKTAVSIIGAGGKMGARVSDNLSKHPGDVILYCCETGTVLFHLIQKGICLTLAVSGVFRYHSPFVLSSVYMIPYAIPEKILDASPPVFSYQIGAQKVYVKKRRPRKNMFGRRMQRLLYAVVGNALAVPAEIPGNNNVETEVANLRKMASLGAHVPTVLYAEENYFVMSDTGEMLNAALREKPEKREEYIVKTIHELRRFHDLGLAHGGTQAKNITVLNDEIYFIDCEEKIPEKNLNALKVRDLFLFLLSLQRDGYEPDLVRLCALYDGHEKGYAFTTIRRAIRIVWPLRIVKWRIFDSISMRDVRTMYAMYCKATSIR